LLTVLRLSPTPTEVVGATTDENHFAKEICGFSLDEFPDPIDKVRNVIKTNIDPIPMFFPVAIPLVEGKTALVVYVPGDQRTPFITRDGRIYRRHHDSSDPVLENSRHTLDGLVARGKAQDEQFATFCRQHERRPPEGISDSKIGWVNLFLRPEPAGVVESLVLRDRDEIDRLLAASQEPFPLGVGDFRGNLPFNLAQPTRNSVLLKHTASKLPNQPGVTAEFTTRGTLSLNIPVGLASLEDVHKTQVNTRAIHVVSALLKHGRDSFIDVGELKTIDIGQVLMTIMVVLAFYRDWLSSVEWIPEFRFALSARGIAETVPFADVATWADQVERWGLPLLAADVQMPWRWEERIAFSTEADRQLWWPVYQVLGRQFGLSDKVAHQALATAAIKAAGLEVPPDFE
jgi:hypothetical protein